MLKNTKGLQQAQHDIESLMNNFERLIFTSNCNDVTVELFGDMTIKNVLSDKGKVDVSCVNSAYKTALTTLKHQRSIKLVQVRNNILKKYKTDIKHFVPEVAEAITELNNQQV